MLGVQSDPRAQPCSPRLGCHCQAGVRPRVRGRENLSDRANLSHSQTQTRLFLGCSTTVRGHQPCSEKSRGREAAWECRCCCCRLSADLPHWVPLQLTLRIGTKIWYFSLLGGKCRADTSKCCSWVLSGAAVSLPACLTDSCSEGR